MSSLFFKHQHKLIVMTRLFLGFIFLGAGMSKLYSGHDFPGIIGPVWLEERLAEYGLGMYARFIAFSQVIAGLLLLTQRFATLGAVLTFPIILNILMVTISLEWRGTPYVNTFLLALNTWLLAYDYHKLKFILTDKVSRITTIPIERNSKKADLIWGIAALIILITIPISFLNLYLAWGICGAMMILNIWNQLRKKI